MIIEYKEFNIGLYVQNNEGMMLFFSSNIRYFSIFSLYPEGIVSLLTSKYNRQRYTLPYEGYNRIFRLGKPNITTS